MAELVLSTVGRALGARFGSVAAALAQSAGAYLGRALDQQIFGETQNYRGARLSDLHIQASTEGASIPAVFGRVRIAGQVIWAARFKEREETQSAGGGKGGGPRVTNTSYRYSLSFAVGLCEGEIARIGRVWANGEAFDLSAVAYRVHRGGEDSAPDPLIEAIEGAENAPAYRGLAYIVFEDLPLERFGNAIPQLSFEIVRPAPNNSDEPRLEDRVRGVCLIPGAGEFVYATTPVRRVLGPGAEAAENQHAEAARANIELSLDQLAADFPNCDSVLLVVGWFGDDLRCGECAIRPGVDSAEKVTTPRSWRVNGLSRAGAHLVSTHDGGPAFGGTPDDTSVLELIAALKLRGYDVGLYPFLFMDVPPGNGLPDPYGAAEQAAYPWRGRITLSSAPGEAGSPDQTSATTAQVAHFFGAAAPSDFSVSAGAPVYTGPTEWSYRRFILHYAKLAQAAGGVDSFIIGSELCALTSARDSATHFPAVDALQALASDVRTLVGAETTLTYAADWSEYFGHQPQDGSGDVLFHLDPLWAHEDIDVVGVDWYAPLTDWRDGQAHLDAAIAVNIHDPAYLQSRIEAGENYDWFYASDAARSAQTRSPITDGAHSEPWVFRAKDIRNFWAREHYNRPGGVRAGSPTPWVPQSKPIWFIELGCPAVDKGANAPNLFSDAKSSESALPPFSNGARDDLIQRRVIEAYLRHWAEGAASNPVSTVDARRMIERSFLWAWDGRPYPAFPARSDVWADAPAWRLGHWLNGRAGLSELGAVIEALCARAGFGDIDVSGVRGAVDGMIVDAPARARDALEPLMLAYDVSVRESEGVLVFFHRDANLPHEIATAVLTAQSEGALNAKRGDGAETPIEARVRFIDAARDYLIGAVSARRLDSAEGGVALADAPLVLEAERAELLAQALLADQRAAIEALSLGLGADHLALEPGDRTVFNGVTYEIERIEDTEARLLELRRARSAFAPAVGAAAPNAPAPPAFAPSPAFAIIDAPPLPGFETDARPLAALFASPWLGAHVLFVGDESTPRAQVAQPAIMGELLWALWPGPVDRWDDGNHVRIKLYAGALESVSRDAILDGANAFAIESADGEWEVVQTRDCVLVEPNTYELSGFLRGCQGSAHAMRAPHPVGARIVKLDQRLGRVEMRAHEWREPIRFVAPPYGATPSDPRATQAELTLPHAGQRPWAPAHLRAKRLVGGDVAVSWVRCARAGDHWGAGEPPLDQNGETYVIEVLDGAGALVRSAAVTASAWTYGSGEQSADFGAPPGSLRLRVAQIDAYGLPGLNSERTISL